MKTKQVSIKIIIFLLPLLSSGCGARFYASPDDLLNTLNTVANGFIGFLTQLGAVTTAPGGSNAGTDYCYGVAVDLSGNVYCTGNTNGSMGEVNGGGQDFFVMKLNSSGVLQWVTQFGSTTTAPGGSNAGNDYGRGVAVDSSGNVYCSGYTSGAMGEVNGGGSDAFVLKLNSSGVLQWFTQLGSVTTAVGGSNAGNEYCNSLGLDTGGNLYCAGYTSGAMGEVNGGGADAFVMKLNSSGVLQWVTHLGSVTTAPGGSNAGNDSCLDVSVDSSGNVYCAGYTTSAMGEVTGGGLDAFVMKLNTSGALQWLTHFGAVTTAPGGSNAGADNCNGVSVDSSGNVYCAGHTQGAMGEVNGGGVDAFVMKLNSSGVLQWLTHFGAVTTAAGGVNTGDEKCEKVSLDSSGNLYCAGHTTGAMGEVNAGLADAVVMKLNSSGVLQWLTQFGAVTAAPAGSNTGDDYCFSISADASGNVYCAGLTNGAMSELNGGSYDAFILALDSNGNL